MAYRRTERVMQRLAARQESILSAARAIAAELGMGAVQIAPVAARAGIAAGTVYRYYPAKTDLVAALVAAVSESEIVALRRAAEAAPGPLSALAAAVLTFGMRAVRHRRLAWSVIAEPVDAAVDAVRLAYRRRLVEELESRIAAAVVAGHLPEQDAALAASALVGALLEGLIGPLAPQTNGDADARASVQTLALLTLRALGVVDARARGLVVQTTLPPDE
jgi:AcrR family transcriptional regulator